MTGSPGRAEEGARGGQVPGTAATLSRHGCDGRRGVGVVLESGKRDSLVRNAWIQESLDGTADLGGRRSRKECGQDSGIREKGTRGGCEDPARNCHGGETARQKQKKKNRSIPVAVGICNKPLPARS